MSKNFDLTEIIVATGAVLTMLAIVAAGIIFALQG